MKPEHLYEELYKSEKDAYYIEMACEAYKLAENWAGLIEAGKLAVKENPDFVNYYLYQAEGEFKVGDANKAKELLKRGGEKGGRQYIFPGFDSKKCMRARALPKMSKE